MKDASGRSKDEAPEPLLHAVNHSTRRHILRLMSAGAEGPALSPTEAAASLSLPLPCVAYHFRVLASTAAVDRVSQRQVRGTIQCFYEPSAALRRAPWVQSLLAETAASD